MKTSDFFFELPEDRIAQTPSVKRGESRLLVCDPQTCRLEHDTVANFPFYLEEGSVVVFNKTRVRKARLFAVSQHGGRIEVLLTERLSATEWRAITGKAKKQRKGKVLLFPGGLEGTIIDADARQRTIRFSSPVDDGYLDRYGTVPLPPYIKREVTAEDEQRYQTVFSQDIGSVAAPTAGLHFTQEIIDAIRGRGIEVVFIDLQVGLGTFTPIRSEQIEEHTMHRETYDISEESAAAITKAKQENRPITAIGTTTVRTLESAWKDNVLQAGEDSTDLYIYPGYTFHVVDQLFTNFHTPKSSLLVMVTAFAGKKCIDKAYQEALRENYRFFSYGDAMFLTSHL
jgi:S-adenosylmethionine:tRNA ribosyltransferase-isomerase